MNKYSIEALQRHVEKRHEVNRKHTLLKELGFFYEGSRYKHPNGKIIMMQVYEKMNYNMLLGRLNSLGFSLTRLAN